MLKGSLQPSPGVFRRGDRKAACDERAHFIQTYNCAFSSAHTCVEASLCSHVHVAYHLLACKTMLELKQQHPNLPTHQPLNYKVPQKAESSRKDPCSVEQTHTPRTVSLQASGRPRGFRAHSRLKNRGAQSHFAYVNSSHPSLTLKV